MARRRPARCRGLPGCGRTTGLGPAAAGPRARRRYVPRWFRLSAELFPGLLCCWPRTLTEAPAGAARPIRFPALALVFAGDRLHPSAFTAARMRSRNSGDSTGTAGATRREGPSTPHPGYGGAAPCPGLSYHAGQTLYERYAARSMRTHGAVEHRTGGYPADARQPALNPGQALARTPRSAGLACRGAPPDAVPGPAAAQATKASWQGNPQHGCGEPA